MRLKRQVKRRGIFEVAPAIKISRKLEPQFDPSIHSRAITDGDGDIILELGTRLPP